MSRARDFADLAGSADAGGLTGRNLIINGAMQVAQRNTSVASLSSTATYSTCDRWEVQYGSSGTFTESQSTTAPSGFSNSLKLDCTSADASPNYLVLMQCLEGQNLQHLKKGTSAAESTTLSFHVRSSKTGTYQVNLRDLDNSRIIGATYTISSANTWEFKSITFAGDTTGAFNNDNGASLDIEWWLAAGSTYNTGAVPTAWEASTEADRAAGLNVAIGASTSDDFHLTGVQLEVGPQATPFEHRSFGDTLLQCQRYLFKGDAQCLGSSDSAGNTSVAVQTPVNLRANPTLVSFSSALRGSVTATATGAAFSAMEAPRVTITVTNSGTVNTLVAGFGGSCSVHLDAEL
tara:strand:+ start:16614 stop:17657 length:1044 start_codon:yes stop_codon:yes gene_type:complete